MASIALNEYFEKFIEKQIKEGRYNNASEVVRAALRLLEDYEGARERWLRDEIPNRYKELMEDPSTGIAHDTALERLEAEHKKRLAKAAR